MTLYSVKQIPIVETYSGDFSLHLFIMIKGSLKVKLTKEAILSRISEYDIFRYYMPTRDWKINSVTFSPFRDESHPSFLIGNRHGFMSFIDFADTSKRGDCFWFVKMLFHLSTLDDVLKKIDGDFGLGISGGEKKDYQRIVGEYKQPEAVKRYSLIQVVTRKFTNSELEYWNSYHQSLDDLRANNIYAVKHVYLNRQKFPLPEKEMVFGYLYDGGHWKIYRPFGDRKNKWVPNNVPITSMDGKENINGCNVAIITKSKKDYMVLKKIYENVCAVQNEGIACFSQENVQHLKDNSQKQILAFDSDVAGVTNSQQITKIFDFSYVNVPRKYLEEYIKDWSDWAKVYGMKHVEDYLNQKL
jgi:hypothetical protein